ncbi:MAG: primosomal protein N' [Candidatus Wallbacteria bacterium HGW-Wallbacteria-1]|jgi:primosomal protein N' (replication factor Y)|uniref:Replication restart protein PriA n=1 Tax=Candidatus Wallbacteria bacterium HGW-Wallbacteria-1 TaxID=2013854 RepID=A0A2N1PUD9_9BACT|nr:MAG: primosomal protein N' [Candidatus Wallbacteria bacterium HGW-Wallbacteria-1]
MECHLKKESGNDEAKPLEKSESLKASAVLIAEVVLKIPVFRYFDYTVPEKLLNVITIGHMVRVPFSGRFGVVGFVVGLREATVEDSTRKLKQIRDFVDAAPLEEGIMELSAWMAERYVCPQGMVLDAITPAPVKRSSVRRAVSSSVVRLMDNEAFSVLLQSIPQAHRARRRLAEVLMSDESQSVDCAVSNASVARSALQWFVEKGVIEIRHEKISRYNPPLPSDESSDIPLPTPHQARALETIRGALDEGLHRVFLIHGITGSGKTEVYLQSISMVLARGRNALVLVPEIALTPQMIRGFRRRFGDLVAVLHSHLSDGERMDEWDRLRTGEARIAVGARSAVFAPLPNLGLIIVDEEHENSYKQARTPAYNAKDVARFRISRDQGLLILGSATPSVEDYHASINGEFELIALPDRVGGKPLPPVRMVDMREEFKAGNYSLFSRVLKASIERELGRGGKVILLLNRRGHSSYVFCRNCGEPIRCQHCDVTMKYHLNSKLLKCHYCDCQRTSPRQCPACNSQFIKYFGAGTQKVVSEAEKLFGNAGILRMDADTTGTKEAHDRILQAFENGPYGILVGTQMVAKGLDIHKVSLVGILSGDLALNLPDFRAGERTFQLVTQVAGRAGRGEMAGEVILQTYQPENPVLMAASNHDFNVFYDMELPQRERHFLPPFSSLVRLVFSGSDEPSTRELSFKLFRALNEAMDAHWKEASRGGGECFGNGSCSPPKVKFIGPEEAPVARIREKYRWHLLVAIDDLGFFSDLLRNVMSSSREFSDTSRITIDVEPQNLL